MNSELLTLLAATTDYRNFLKVYITDLEKTRGRGSKALLSRRVGFSSRSYLSEVLSGKKGLSRDTMRKIKSSLKLGPLIGKYFELLVFHSHPHLSPKTSIDSLQEKLILLRKEILSSSINQEVNPDFNFPELFQVYAALGTQTSGANFSEIQFRTHLPEELVKKHLGLLMDRKQVEQKGERFFATSSTVDDFSGNDPDAIAFMVKKVGLSISKNSEHLIKNKDNLNFYSAFSIKKKDLPQLKKDLQSAIVNILDEYQNDDGDCVEQIFVSLFQNPLD